MSWTALNYYDASQALAPVNTAGNLQYLMPNAITFGDSTLLANSLQSLKLDMRVLLQIVNQSSANPNSDNVRIIVFADLQPVPLGPASTDFLTFNSPAIAFTAFKNFDNDSRFVFLYDDVIDVNIQASTGGTDNVGIFESVIQSMDCSRLPRSLFIPSAAASACSIYIWMASKNGVVRANWSTRLWYKFL